MDFLKLNELFNSMEFDHVEDMTLNSRVLFVDSLNCFKRNYCAVPTMDQDGNNIGGVTGFLKSIGSVVRDHHPTRVVIVWDGKGGSQRRRKIFPEYKQHRKVTTRLNRPQDFKTEEQEGENMLEQLQTLVKLLKHTPFTTIQIDGVEADDIIAYLAKHVESLGGEAIIYSSDQDYLQLVSDNIKVYNGQRKTMFTTDSVVNKYNVHPKNYLFFKALIGDNSDNINGVSKVKEKTALKYLPEFSSGDIEVNYKLIEEKYSNEKKLPVAVQNMLNEHNIIERNLTLMDLHTQQMSGSARLTSMRIFNELPIVHNKIQLTKEMASTKILSNFDRFDEWYNFTILPLNQFINKERV